jgi:hypothetical protein
VAPYGDWAYGEEPYASHTAGGIVPPPFPPASLDAPGVCFFSIDGPDTSVFEAGATLRLRGQFYLPAGPADPVTVTLRVTAPSGVEATLATVRDGLGDYHHDLAGVVAGPWRGTWSSTGPRTIASAEWTVIDPASP